MALVLNGVEITKLYVNGVDCDIGYLNNVEVFSSKALFSVSFSMPSTATNVYVRYKTEPEIRVYPNSSGYFNMTLPSSAIRNDIKIRYEVPGTTNTETLHDTDGVFTSVSKGYGTSMIYTAKQSSANYVKMAYKYGSYTTYEYITVNLNPPTPIGREFYFYPNPAHASTLREWNPYAYYYFVTTTPTTYANNIVPISITKL